MPVDYFSLQPVFSAQAPIRLMIQEEKRELFLSANLRLCAVGNHAHIESRRLAEQACEAVLPRLKKRYGPDTEIHIVKFKSSDDKWTRARIAKDSVLLRKRLANGVLAPNVQP